MPEFHAEALPATTSDILAQGTYVAARVRFEPVTLREQGTENTTEPPRCCCCCCIAYHYCHYYYHYVCPSELGTVLTLLGVSCMMRINKWIVYESIA